jgi:putative peptidoglycan lipid II flippase
MSLSRSTLIVGLATLASRLLGFARDVIVARTLGAGPAADAFLVALRLPNLVRRVLGDGGINAGFVPLYARLKREEGEDAARAFAGQALIWFALSLCALTALVEIAAPLVALSVAPFSADDPDRLYLATLYIRLSWPFIAAASLAALMAAHLNAERRFAIAGFAPALVNVLLIAAYWLVARELEQGGSVDAAAGGVQMSLALSAAGFVQLALVGWALARLPQRPRISGLRHGLPAMRKLLAFGLPALAAGAAPQLILLAATQAASAIPGAVSWLYYADRVFQLPLSLLGVGLGIVLISAASDATSETPATERALEAALLLGWPASTGLAVLSLPIAQTLFQRGAFDAGDTAGTAAALLAFALGLPAAVASKVFAPAFFARGAVRMPLAATIVAALVALAAAILLAPVWGAFGAAFGAAFGFWLHAALLAAGLAREGARMSARFLTATLRALLACAGMAVALWWGMHLLAPVFTGSPWPIRLIALGVLCCCGALVYGSLALMLGTVRRDDIAALLRR